MIKKIATNPNILRGKPVIKGTRIPVHLILNLVAAGYTFERIREAYPQLSIRDIKAALQYAGKVIEHETHVKMKNIAMV